MKSCMDDNQLKELLLERPLEIGIAENECYIDKGLYKLSNTYSVHSAECEILLCGDEDFVSADDNEINDEMDTII